MGKRMNNHVKAATVDVDNSQAIQFLTLTSHESFYRLTV